MTIAKSITKTLDISVEDVRIDLTATIRSYDLTDTQFIFEIKSSNGMTVNLTGSTAMYIVEYVHNSQTYAIQGDIDIIGTDTLSFNLPEDLKGYSGTVLIGIYVQMTDGTKIDIKDIAVRIEPSIMDKDIDFSAKTYFKDFESIKAEVVLEGENAKTQINQVLPDVQSAGENAKTQIGQVLPDVQAEGEKVKTDINAVVSDVNGYADSQKQTIDNIVSDVHQTGDTAKADINATLPTLQGQVSEIKSNLTKVENAFGNDTYEDLHLDVIMGAYARKENGIIVADSSNVMGYVEKSVVSGEKYCVTTSLSGNCALVYYNDNNYVSDINGIGAVTDYEITIPDGVTLMRVSNRYASTTPTIVKSAITSYQPFVDKVNSYDTDIADLGDDVSALKGYVDAEMQKIQYADYIDKTGNIIENAFLHYNTGAITSASNASYCIINVSENETYQIECLLVANCGIVGYDANNNRVFGFNDETSGDYKIDTNLYEITIPSGVTKLGVSTRNQTTPISIMLKQMLVYDFDSMKNKVDEVDFDVENLNDRAYAMETRARFVWKPFDTGKVVFMTDDALADIGVITAKLMDEYDFPMSYACITSKLDSQVDTNTHGWETVAEVLLDSQAYGGEVFSHSIDANDWSVDSTRNGGYDGAIPKEESERRLRESKKTLRSIGIKCNGFISPRGSNVYDYGEQVAKYFRYAYYQGNDIPQIYHFSRTNIKGMSLTDLKNKIDKCATDKSLLVLMCHSVIDTNGEGYGFYPNGFTINDFTAIMDYLKWGSDATKTTQRTDIEVTSIRDLYNQYASI